MVTTRTPGESGEGIVATAVSRRFGALVALDPIDLTVAAGEVVTLLGPSGCGKTTLLRILGGLDSPTTGTVTIGGDAPDAARAAKRIGLVPQTPALLPWRTVGQNARLLVELNRGSRAERARDPVALLDEVGLGDFAGAYPHELSGGMQQRVALVRAFALGAQLLLMDEPFAALDEITRAEMRHLLARLSDAAGTSVVFVTHSIAEAVYLSDRVVVMSPRPGRVVAEQPIDLARPRRPEVEDDPRFFALETIVRNALRAGAGERDG